MAVQYLDRGYDVLMGGGNNNFDSKIRSDKRDMYAEFRKKGYQIARNKTELKNLSSKASKESIICLTAMSSGEVKAVRFSCLLVSTKSL